MEIQTKRLKLIPCSRNMLKGLINNTFFKTTGMKISKGWPLEEIQDALPLFLAWVETGYTPMGWGMWLMILEYENIIIGGAGFLGPADESCAVEIGYSIAPEFRRQDYTLEACEGLIQWAFSKEIKTIKAKCEKSNLASINLLEKLGMEFCAINEEGELEYFLSTRQSEGL